MSTVESVLQGILEQRAIGAAKIGGDFSRVAHRYGDPTEMVDPREYGFDERCRIWNYDEVQVWSNECGVIDRVFFKVNGGQTQCRNRAGCVVGVVGWFGEGFVEVVEARGHLGAQGETVRAGM